MGLSSRIGPRRRRITFLTIVAAGTLLAVVGAATDHRPTLTLGVAVIGLGTLTAAKLSLEAGNAGRDARHSRQASRVAQLEATTRAQSEQLQRSMETLRSIQRRVDLVASTMSESSAALNEAIARLGERLRVGISPERLEAMARNGVADPLLSIAIPSFNRPGKLAECLASVEREVVAQGSGIVEVCITDDASTDPGAVELAVAFAERLPFVSLRINRTNIGLERNLIESCAGCRGRYVLILGNDDVLVPGALQVVIEDLVSGDSGIYLYDKVRIDHDGRPREPVPGSVPADVPRGEVHGFVGLLDAAQRQGLFSTFGFISQVVFARDPFMGVDAAAYLDLTMYPQVFIFAEAFAASKVTYRNVPIVQHRTPTHAQKLAEALGRKEEPFMAAGRDRATRYFGPTYAAALQRAIDRGAFGHRDLLGLPEALMTDRLLIDWIEANCRDAESAGVRFAPDVVDDAGRFFDGVRRAREDSTPGVTR